MDCPFCKEKIADKAIKCKHCGSMLEEVEPKIKKEKLYYKDERVSVTSSRVIIDNKTFALRNITSVSIGENKAKFDSGLFVVILIICFISIVIVQFSKWGGLGFFSLFKLPDAFSSASPFLSMVTSGGEQPVLSNENNEYIEKIIKAINEAIINS